MSAWLRETTLTRIPFPVSFWLQVPQKKFLWKMEGGREVAAIWYPRHIVASLLARLAGVRQWPGLDLLLAPSSASLTLGLVYV